MPPGARDSPRRAAAAPPATLLPREFLGRPSPEVAPALLGCVLESELDGGLVAVALTEVEAYTGESDPASHAYRGPTRRNAVMYGPPGHAYVYFTYGMYFCVNLVCLPEGTASAVLLRAGAVLAGAGLARQRRAAARRAGPAGLADRDLARGRPGCARPWASTARSMARTSATPGRCSGSARPGPRRRGAQSATGRGWG